MKVALIFPRVKEQVHGMWPPLGIITLGTLLREKGHEVWCYDSSFDPGPERVINDLKQKKPDVVGVSCLTDFIPSASKIIKEAKKLGAHTVVGGPHPTIMPEAILQDIPELDFAVMGEAENSLPLLLEKIEAGEDTSSIKGIAFRQNGEIINTGKPEPIDDLDEIPVPDRDLLDVNDVYLKSRAINMHASRGCPFNCTFCQPTLERLFGKKVRYQGAKRVAEEIKECNKKYGITDFFFHDDTFTIKKKWLQSLVDELDRAGLRDGFRYVVNSRVDTFDEERAELLRKMGVYYVLFGVETGSQEILDSLKKGTTIAQAKNAFKICKKFGFRTHAYILLGSPCETKETLAATEDIIEKLKPNTVHISIYTPLKGTYLADECEKEGKITVDDYSDFDYYLKETSSGDPPIKIPGLTYKDLTDSRARILKKRKTVVLFDNFKEMIRDFIREPSPDKFIFRYQFYSRMKHYFG
jgi:radical SAM superfamily enzyme YgiQ (UPF0313 family)